MKNFNDSKAEIYKKIRGSRKILLMLDFDGTISPIVSRPEDAYLPKETKKILQKIMQTRFVAIVTGRPLNIIKQKIGIRGILYTASHGHELQFGEKIVKESLDLQVVQVFKELKKRIKKLIRTYPKLIIEEKRYSVIFHYHLLRKGELNVFLSELQNILKWLKTKKMVRVFHDKKTVEVAPSGSFNKAYAVKKIFEYLNKKGEKDILSIYIGDSSPDEDVFKVLRSGITVRVGNKEGSKAKYYFDKRLEVDDFLYSILRLIK